MKREQGMKMEQVAKPSEVKGGLEGLVDKDVSFTEAGPHKTLFLNFLLLNYSL
jgi:hypothetical protein